MFYLLSIGLSSEINYCLVVNQVIGNPLSIEATKNHACIYRTLYFENYEINMVLDTITQRFINSIIFC